MQIGRSQAAVLMVAIGSSGLAGFVLSKAVAQAPSVDSGPAARAQTQQVAAAAEAFLATLSPEQRQKTLYGFTPQKQATGVSFSTTVMPGGPGGPRGPRGAGGPGGAPGAGFGPPPGGGPDPRDSAGEKYGAAVWSNFPVSFVERPGLQLGKMTPAQRAAATRFLQAVLSSQGYEKVQKIMGSDQALADARTDFLAGRGSYSLAIFGTPSAAKPWMIEFNGHHLALNIVLAGEHGVMTPTLTGAQPAVYTAGGKTVRVLAGENDKAFTLLNALNETQRKQAMLGYHVGNLVLGPGHDGQTIVPEGLKGSAMTPQQRALMLDLIAEWAGIEHGAYARPRLEALKAGLDETWFAWSGPATHEPDKNGSAYYRIQGPKVVIEFSPQVMNGSDPSDHVHTIYRDPTNEYGTAYTLP